MTKYNREALKDKIRIIKDFPVPGIVYEDITPLLASPNEMEILMNHLTQRYRTQNIDYIAGADARGFLFGSVLANKLNVGFIPIRKKGKLPGDVFSEDYTLEYGEGTLEIADIPYKPEARVVFIDDLLATGGTAFASEKLINRIGYCVECCFILEIPHLKGRSKLRRTYVVL